MDNDDKKLPFQMQHQLASQWCWAAVARSVFHFYDTRASPQENSQCTIATELLIEANLLPQGQQCCPNPWGGPCDRGFYLDTALKHVENFLRQRSNALSWETVVREIDAGRVVCAFIQWERNLPDGHFVCITGYTGNLNGTASVFVDDPLSPERFMSFENLKNNYKNTDPPSGIWNHSYLTQPKT